ncbi:MAG: Fe-S cluster assembly protein SufD [Bacteroidales bacterium]|nr:Fe-S cluster assembly protein SufD [Bacteroidales bacterium]
MEPMVLTPISKERLLDLYQENRSSLSADDSPAVRANREKALDSFRKLGFPDKKMEDWRNTDISKSLGLAYDYPLQPSEEDDMQKVFRCNIPHLDTAVIGQLNGWFVSKDVPLMELGNGIIIGSLAEAMKKYPHLVEPHLGNYTDVESNGFAALNTAFATDGTFIYIPDGVKSEKAVQLVNVIQHRENIFIQSRNLIILGKEAKLTVVHCDDSYDHQPSFSNIVTEIVVGEGAFLDHYKLQNLNNNSTLVSSTWFHLEREAKLESHYLSLNGALLRNNTYVRFNGSFGSANIYGLYLMDNRQHIDNYVAVDHASPDCISNELFKGILDEHATGVFNGHILVQRDAQRTNASQNNRNLLLTDTAKINSKPFLEIYNDDVKCSHGSTTGQLDETAMFYLRQRGIGEDNARMLLMFAFADEVVSKIAIEPLRYRIEDMVKKRLQGELQICEQCVLHCSTPEHPMEFKIDLSKI